jgi:periodic tryptophan protein 2
LAAGRAWSAATTEGLLTYSLDVAMVFDPYDLAIDVTPERTKQVLENREFAKALMLSFRLNEQNLILRVVENIPPQDSEYLIDFFSHNMRCLTGAALNLGRRLNE